MYIGKNNEKEITSFVLWGEASDMIMSALIDYQSALKDYKASLSGVSRDMINENLGAFTQMASIQSELEGVKAKSDKTQEDLDKVSNLTQQLAILLAQANEKSPEIVDSYHGFSKEKRDGIKILQKNVIDLREEILKEIALALDPALDYAKDLQPLPSGVKSDIIYAVMQEPQNNIDRDFFAQMIRLMNH